MNGPRHVSVLLREFWRELGLPPHLPLEREWRRNDALAADDRGGFHSPAVSPGENLPGRGFGPGPREGLAG